MASTPASPSASGRIGVFANAEEVMEVVTQMINDVGFNVQLEMMERARHANFQARPFPEDVGPNINLIMSDNDRGDASFSLGNFESSGNQSATFNQPDLDKMINDAIILTGAGADHRFPGGPRLCPGAHHRCAALLTWCRSPGCPSA